MTSIIKLKPLSGAQDEGPPCYLLQVDQFRFLLDCGWDEDLSPTVIKEIKRHIHKVDAVLLTYPDQLHLGALPYLVGKCGLSCPVYATVPVYKMGQMFMYDLYQSRNNSEEFELFTLDDVDQAFDKIIQLKYSQTVSLTGKGHGLQITPLPAGHMIGGTIWKILKEGEEEIVYAVDYNHKKERHLNGCILEGKYFSRPHLMITDAFNANYNQSRRRVRDEQLMTTILQTMRRDGNVMIAVDTAGRMLELAQLLDQMWRSTESGLTTYSLALLNNVSFHVVEFAKSQVEWMSDKIMRAFEEHRSNPYHFKHMKLCHNLSELGKIPEPKVVLCSQPDLQSGFSRDLFVAWCGNPKNSIILTNRTSPKTLARWLIDNPDKETVTMEVRRRIRLEGVELEEYVKKKQEKEAKEKLSQLQTDRDESSDESEEEMEVDSGTPMPGTSKLKHDIIIKQEGKGRSGFFKQAKKSYPMFPFTEERLKWDEYGEVIYGSKNKRKCIGLERAIDNVVKKHQTEKIPKKFPSRILGPPTKWQIFHRQQDAFRCAKSTSKDLHVFAFESESFMENTGQRLYLVASYPVFWHYYSQLGQDKRHHYEVIPEGAVCKLYFDLEFDMTVNPDSNGPVMVKILVQYVCLCMESIFRIKCTSDDFLDLDASTEKKFSRHLIWQVKTAAFKDNIHAGRFVCSIISRIFEKLKQNKAEETDGDRSCVVTKCDPASDKGVLNNFTNQGQSVVNCNVDNLDSQINDKEDCQGSESESKNSNENPIVDHIDRVIEKFDKEDLKKLIVKNKDGDDVSFCDLGVYTKNRNFRLVLSSKLHKNNPLLLSDHITTYRQVSGDIDVKKMFEDSLVANVRYCNGLKILAFDEEYSSSSLTLTRRRKDTLNTQECLGGYSKSPYPEVDEYIIGLITENAGKGVIRHWTYFHQGELLVYEIAKYRYCHNVGRHHKSNNIMLVADLQKGVLYQKCHDPDCHMQNYKSPEWPLPRNVLPANYFDEADDLDQEIDDAELLNSVTEIENQYMKQSREQPDLFELEDGDDEELVAAAVQLDRSLNENS